MTRHFHPPMIMHLASLIFLGAGCGWSPWQASGDEVADDDLDSYRSYFIAEITNYSGPDADCPQESLNDVTTAFQMTLQAEGWTGQRRADAQSLPSDFIDSTINAAGHDAQYADAAPVTVFAGHGHRGIHIWANNLPPYDQCSTVTAGYYLGTLVGDQNAVFINAASCGGGLGDNPDHPESCFYHTWANSEFRQWLGFIDSPTIGFYNLSEFFLSLSTNPTSTSGQLEPWLILMEFPVEGVHNLPVVYTKLAEDELSLAGEAFHYETNMRSGRNMSVNPEPKRSIAMSPTVGEVDPSLFCIDPPFGC